MRKLKGRCCYEAGQVKLPRQQVRSRMTYIVSYSIKLLMGIRGFKCPLIFPKIYTEAKACAARRDFVREALFFLYTPRLTPLSTRL